MKWSGAINIVSFRSAWASFHFAALLILGIAAYSWLGFTGAVLAIVLALMYSPLSFYATATDGTLAGFYGWGNPLRYLMPLIVVGAMGLTAVDWRPPRLLSGRLMALGGLWAIGGWLAQESLTTTVSAAALLLILLWLTGTVDAQRILAITCRMLAGFSCIAAP